jgi:hypothetical protein
MRDPAAALPRFAAERDELERRWLREQPEGAAAVAEADTLVERWGAAAPASVDRDHRPVWVRRYWRLRNRRAKLNAAA